MAKRTVGDTGPLLGWTLSRRRMKGGALCPAVAQWLDCRSICGVDMESNRRRGTSPPPYGIERNAAVESPEYRLCGNGIRILRLPLVAQDDKKSTMVGSNHPKPCHSERSIEDAKSKNPFLLAA